MIAHAFVVFASQWGSGEKEAASVVCEAQNALRNDLNEEVFALKAMPFNNLQEWLPSEGCIEKHVILFILSIGENGLPPTTCLETVKTLNEMAYDHRVERASFSLLSYAIIGRGDSSYGNYFGKWAIEFDKTMRVLGAQRGVRCVMKDISNPHRSEGAQLKTHQWFINSLKAVYLDARSNFLEDSEDSENETTSDASDTLNDENLDIEDVGISSTGLEMINSTQRKILERQGYKLIGTHSAIKLCRWTKHQLRGQGGCYKHTFYGINSHQCMEATSSLACANKCVFCWRHHKNPVGTYWRWKIDEPSMIVQEGLKHQHTLIKECWGVPGVQEKGRFPEGMAVRHCALSLVGEPIMYPRINELIEELHQRRISTFLVTNAQFPEQIRDLTLCTQLYVSIDGTTPEALKKIDRPLFIDYWERFRRSLIFLKERKERTVYRVTLVKHYNDESPASYVELVALGCPDLIELKGVTFAGHSLTSGIRMSNVPTHDEVISFGQRLCQCLQAWRQSVDSEFPEYEIALEHEHSCSVLLAQTKFKKHDKWNLWIDFNYFFEWSKSNETADKDGVEYSSEAPFWALFGSREKGFDPSDQRKCSKARSIEIKKRCNDETGESTDQCNACNKVPDMMNMFEHQRKIGKASKED
eukprot:Gregarina_sp_Poly_1__2220@NODE_1593_length_3762_cov_126_889310_g1049_i0_p1_GENE_NODE_1593_length_3762_cov_126_889310_g1049_i0NODE_1593_length_3762_cov_126_889310_g1049_i0_p1_ORF_typecomplete_len642_score64_72Wyosine_form/PF08608_12/2_7e20Radical_SAM/PF04055_21/1_9e17Flavodoxin_1/PF00258_25/6_5e13Fer4_14/PF13394_6/0_00057Fer4_12/PF13353_6/1_7e04Fer4_12/PF13353_6/3_4e02Fer4_12/PF13353_6/0_0012DUF2605/PF10792_9/90DUF2605/PF10792_9/14DUF2605/PF10792_9/4_1e03_NODE_1593_length_3762_cov_126_889310_g104